MTLRCWNQHLPLAMGWMVRVLQAGAIVGVQDFWAERIRADLHLHLTPAG
jgi:hypothetical protein